MLPIKENNKPVSLISILADASRNRTGIHFINSEKVDSIGYDGLIKQARTILCFLQKYGVKEGDEVILQLDNNQFYLAVFWACLMGKIIPVPLSYATNSEYKNKVLKVYSLLKNPYLIADKYILDKLREYCDQHDRSAEFVSLPDQVFLIDDALEETDEGKVAEIQSDQIAYIQFSSGSTGEPKGVKLTHGNLIANISDISSRSNITSSDRMLSWMPLTHDMGLICFHLTGVLCSIDQYIMPTSLFIRRPVLWLEKAHAHHITMLYSPNFGYHYCLMALDRLHNPPIYWDLSCIRLIYNGAEPILVGVCERFLERLSLFKLAKSAMFPGYGLAEASVAVTLPAPGQELKSYRFERDSLSNGKQARVVTSDQNSVQLVALGQPMHSTSLRVSDDNDIPLQEGVVGHIQIKGDSVTTGYYQNSAATHKAFTADGWLRTGDIGVIVEGHLFITGRHKDIIILNGQNYYPSDIENLLMQLEGVSCGEIIVAGITSPDLERNGLLVFVLYKGELAAFSRLVKQVKELITTALSLSVMAVVPIRKVPKTSSGKVQRYKLVKQFVNGDYQNQLAALNKLEHLAWPSALSTEDQLLKVVARVMRVPSLDSTTNFFEMRINSLKAVELAEEINRILRANISLQDVFSHPSVEALSKFIRTSEGEEAKELLPISEQAYHELSATQSRFWFQNILYQGVPNPLHISLSYAIQGALDSARLETSINHILKKHESLRTIFPMHGDGPKQEILKEASSVIRVGVLHHEDATTRVAEMIDQELREEFDLSHDIAIRFRLLKVASDRFVFFITLHHIICDGWSISWLAQELSTIYNALGRGDEFDKSLSPIQYKEAVAWKSKHLTARLVEHRCYWKEQLHCFSPLSGLSLNRLDTGLTKRTFGHVAYEFDQDKVDRVMTIAKQKHATLYTILLTLASIALSRMTGQQDFTIGTDSAGRTRQDFNKLIGCFIETLTIRILLGQYDTFDHILLKAKKAIYDGMKYQSYPIESIASDFEIKCEDLFNVLFLYQEYQADLSLEGLNVSSPQLNNRVGLVDFTVEFTYQNDSLALHIIYNQDLFERYQVDTFKRYVETLILRVSDDPRRAFNQYDLTTKEEKDLILTTFNLSCEAPVESFVETFNHAVLKYPYQCAIVDGDFQLTYTELNERANQLANYFNRLGLRKSDHLGVMMHRSYRSIITVLAALKSGIAYVPVDPDLPADRIQYILADCSSRFVVVDGLIRPMEIFPVSNPAFIFYDSICLEPSSDDSFAQNYHNALDIQQPAYILYTSGTIGQPKGVVVRQSALSNYVNAFRKYFALSENDVVIHQASLSFDTSVEEIFPILCEGGKLVIHAEGGRDIEGLVLKVMKEQVTVLSTVPAVLREVNKVPNQLTSLKTLISGGDRLDQSCIDNLLGQMNVYNTYGPTECTVCCTYHKVEELADVSIIGAPIQNTKVYIFDSEFNLQPVGCVGQIGVSGMGLADGYLNSIELTEKKFVDNPFEEAGKLYLTGDLGRWTKHGTIQFLGRNDDQVKVNGQRIELEEITQLLLKHTEIVESIVLVHQDHLVAYYTSDIPIANKALKSYVSSKLPAYMVPAFFLYLENFTYSVSGKIDRKVLPDPFTTSDNLVFDLKEEVKNDIEIELIQLWKQELEHQDIGVFDNFFLLGGNSIKAFRLCSAISKQFNISLPLQELFANATVRELSDYLSSVSVPMLKAIPLAQKSDLYPASYAQQRLWLLNEIDAEGYESNLSWSYEIIGPLNLKALEMACHKVLQRHEILRTTFEMKDGLLMQRVHDPSFFQFTCSHDINPQNLGSEQLEAIVKKEATKKLNLEKDPLFNVTIFEITEKHYIVSFLIHHMVIDGWSANILVQELLSFYQSDRSAYAVSSELPTVQYKDYACWERSLLSNGLLDNSEKYWREKLSGQLTLTTLPYDYDPDTNAQASKNEFFRVKLPEMISLSMTQYCGKHRISPTIILSSALSALLHHHTGAHDIVLGLMNLGRGHTDLDEVIGFFVNTLPLRVNFHQEATLSELVEITKVSQTELLEHQLYPIQLLSQHFKKRLFTINVSSVVDETSTLDQLVGLEVREFDKKSTWRNDFDISLALVRSGNTYELQMLYDARCYQLSTIERNCAHLMSLIVAICTEGNKKLSELTEMPSSRKPADYWQAYLGQYPGDKLFPADVPTSATNIKSEKYKLDQPMLELLDSYRQSADHSNLAIFGTLLGELLNQYRLLNQSFLGVAELDITLRRGEDMDRKALFPMRIVSSDQSGFEALTNTHTQLVGSQRELPRFDYELCNGDVIGKLFEVILLTTEADEVSKILDHTQMLMEIHNTSLGVVLTELKGVCSIHYLYNGNRVSARFISNLNSALHRSLQSVFTYPESNITDHVTLTVTDFEEFLELNLSKLIS